MTYHECVWVFRGAGIRCTSFPKCPKKLSNKQAEAMLNAAERLNAKDAKVLDDLMPTSIPAYLVPAWQKAVDALHAYAKARGGT